MIQGTSINHASMIHACIYIFSKQITTPHYHGTRWTWDDLTIQLMEFCKFVGDWCVAIARNIRGGRSGIQINGFGGLAGVIWGTRLVMRGGFWLVKFVGVVVDGCVDGKCPGTGDSNGTMREGFAKVFTARFFRSLLQFSSQYLKLLP